MYINKILKLDYLNPYNDNKEIIDVPENTGYSSIIRYDNNGFIIPFRNNSFYHGKLLRMSFNPQNYYSPPLEYFNNDNNFDLINQNLVFINNIPKIQIKVVINIFQIM